MALNTMNSVEKIRAFLKENGGDEIDLNQKITYYSFGHSPYPSAATYGLENEVYLIDPIGASPESMAHEAVHAYTIDADVTIDTQASWLGEGCAMYVVQKSLGAYSEALAQVVDLAKSSWDFENETLKNDINGLDEYLLEESWFEYMVEKYDFKTMVQVLRNNDKFEETLGITFKDSQVEWFNKKILNQ